MTALPVKGSVWQARRIIRQEDLEKYPEDLVKRACRNWRNGNNRYAPYAAGALMESVKDEFIERQTIFAKAGSVLEIVGDAA